MPFIPGYVVTCRWAVAGAADSTAIQITDHTWAEMVEKLVVTSSGHAGLQALIAGVFSGDGNVKGFVNSDLFPWGGTLQIRAGNNGLLIVDYGTAAPAILPALVTKVNRQHAVAGAVQFDFDISFNILASVGNTTYQRPA